MATLSAGNYTFNYNRGEGSQIDRTNGFPDGTNDYPLNFEAEGESYTKITIGRNGNRHWVTIGPYAQEYDLDDAIVYDDTLDGKTITVTEEQSVDSALKSFFDNYTDYSALSAPKAVSLDNLQTFKGKCDETYAPMSRALPAPAGTTDAGKVPTVNSAGNGYTLQTPSGGGKQLYNHYISCTVTGIGITSPLKIYFNFISTSGTVLTDMYDLAEAIKNQFLSCKGNLEYSVGGDSAIPIYITSDGSNISMGYITQETNNIGEETLTALETFHFSDRVNEI